MTMITSLITPECHVSNHGPMGKIKDELMKLVKAGQLV